MPDPVNEDDLPENHAVQQITDLLLGMDGMTNCMALGILEVCKMHIFEMNHCDNEDHPEKLDLS